MNTTRKNTIIYIIAVLLLAGVGFLGIYLNQVALAGDTPLRLHVIANSDSPYDQQVKLIVRDKALEILNADLKSSKDKDEAMAKISQNLNLLEEGCREVLAQYADYDLYAYVGEGSFPTKAYGDMLLPAGNYDALKIVLGDGEGKNWWCVLFPPLCFIDLASSKEQTVMSTPGDVNAEKKETIQVRLKVNELLGNW